VSADGSHPVTRVMAKFDRRGAVPLGEGDFCRAYLLDEDIALRIARHDRADAALRLEESLLPVIAADVALVVPLPVASGEDPESGTRGLRGPRAAQVRSTFAIRIPIHCSGQAPSRGVRNRGATTRDSSLGALWARANQVRLVPALLAGPRTRRPPGLQVARPGRSTTEIQQGMLIVYRTLCHRGLTAVGG
jgi:hypothetical protein